MCRRACADRIRPYSRCAAEPGLEDRPTGGRALLYTLTRFPQHMSFSRLANEIEACNASQWDDYDDSSYNDEAGPVATAHIVSSAVSALCCLVVLGVSAQIEQLRRFPNNMLVWKTACDLLTSVVLLAINISLLVLPQPDVMERGAIICSNGLLASLVGFSLLASPGW